MKQIIRKWFYLCLALTLLFSGVFFAQASGVVNKVVVCQAGYSAGDLKIAYAIANDALSNPVYEIYDGAALITSGAMKDEGTVWGNRVYSIDFSGVTATGSDFLVKTNGVSSFRFSIYDNIWSEYRRDMLTYYRVQRAGVATVDALTGEYADTLLSPKAYHLAGHLDDAWGPDKLTHYDLTGGWYDAGDYGLYGENQWVGGEIALAYLRHADAAEVQFDFDHNGLPDLLDEAKVGAVYAMKEIDAFGGLMYNIKFRIKDNSMGSWTLPYKLDGNGNFDPAKSVTDNIIGAAGDPNRDDRYATNPSVEGSAKTAGMLAAVARAFQKAGKNDTYVAVNLPGAPTEPLVDACVTRALIAYNYAYTHQDGPVSNYLAIGGIDNPLLWAEVELFLLTGDRIYYDRAVSRINTLDFTKIRCTNYWDLRPLALIELYPAAIAAGDTASAGKIHDLLKARVDYFLTSANDTPYGVLNEFSDFGVNEPHMSYVGDMLRYYEVFKEPAVLRAVKKGLYWVMGNNPWNISWVSGIGGNYVKYLHSRLDEDAYDTSGKAGVVIPGAMVSGPNMKNPQNDADVNPWYVDQPVGVDGSAQWRYNEHSISIQAGLLYTVISLAAVNENPAGGITPADTVVLSPQIGDSVTGNVKIFVMPQGNVNNMAMAVGNENAAYSPLSLHGDIYNATLDVSDENPFKAKRVVIRATDTSGAQSYSATHFIVAPPLPSYSVPLLYDDFAGNGTWGSKNMGWVNWWNNGTNGKTDGKYARTVVDGRNVGKFAQPAPINSSSEAQFRPWGDAPNWTGYQYLYLTVRNTGANTNLQVKVELNGKGGFQTLAPSNDWTTLRYDLNAILGANKVVNTFYIWLKSGSAPGELCIDDIKVGNEGTPPVFNLTNTGVDKTEGDERTVFNFHVTYSQAANIKPSAVQLVIDGVVRTMMEADSTDVNYTDGKEYILSTSLARGEHSYYFRTNDMVTATQSGPAVNAANGAPVAPQAPGNLRITARTGRTITLTWDASKGNRSIAGYYLYNGASQIAVAPGNITSYTINGLAAATNYRFSVKAADTAANLSEPSNIVSYILPPSAIRYEAEKATGINEIKSASDWPNGSSNGYAKRWTNGDIVWTANFPRSGDYPYTARVFGYDGSETFDVVLDGVVAGSYALTGTNQQWKSVNGVLTGVTAGTHTVAVRAKSMNSTMRFICDYLDLTGTIPGSFSLLSPADSASGQQTIPVLNWSESTGTAGYTLIVADNNNFTNPIFNTDVGAATSKQIIGLNYSTTYYWKVIASNANDSLTASNSSFSFTTKPAGDPPGSFTLNSPASGSTILSTSQTFSWNISNDATGYTLVVADNSDFANPFYNENVGNVTSKQVNGLAYKTTYYWKVIAGNPYGNLPATNSDISFQVAPSPVRFGAAFTSGAGIAERHVNPDSPGNPAETPLGWIKLNFNNSIAWTVNFPSDGIYFYAVRALNNTGNQTTFQVQLDSGAKVTYTTTSRDGKWPDFIGRFDNVAAGIHTVRIYSVGSNPTYNNPRIAQIDIYGAAPALFGLTGPADLACDQSLAPVLSWLQNTGAPSAVNYAPLGATSYTLTVDNDSDFTSPVYHQDVGNVTSQQINWLKTATKYYWKVMAHNVNGDTPAAADFSFTTAAVAPGSFDLISPANNAVNIATSPTLNWRASLGAESYSLVLDDDSDFASPIYDQDIGAATSAKVDGLQNLTTYYWKVIAHNPYGNTTSTGNFNFTTIIAAPGSFIMQSPVNGDKKVSTSPLFRWSAAVRAAGYILIVSANSDLSSPIFNEDVGNITTKEVTGLSFSTVYYWKVIAVNPGGETSASSGIYSFNTDKKDKKNDEEKAEKEYDKNYGEK